MPAKFLSGLRRILFETTVRFKRYSKSFVHEEDRQLLAKRKEWKIEFTDYDWSLNDLARKSKN